MSNSRQLPFADAATIGMYMMRERECKTIVDILTQSS